MSSTSINSDAQTQLNDALGRLKTTIGAYNQQDLARCQNATLDEVFKALRKLEKELQARKCLRNMRRLLPFLQALEHYSKSLEVACNGTPYLPWIWAPIKLVIQIASEWPNALEKLIEAYSQIGDSLPVFDKLGEAFRGRADFQKLLSMVYSDILDFHQEAYKFFKKKGWQFFFNTLWGKFDRRFQHTLQSFHRASVLIKSEAIAADILDASNFRRQMALELEKQESDREYRLMQNTLNWLEVCKDDQETELTNLQDIAHNGSCDWVFRNDSAKSWMNCDKYNKTLWLRGKPGSGKSVIAAEVTKALLKDRLSTTLYYFCTFQSPTVRKTVQVLRALVAQLLRANPDLVGYVFEQYINSGSGRATSSVPQLRKLLADVLRSIKFAHIIVDGLDEFEEEEQARVLSELLRLTQSDSSVCKILISSRDKPNITPVLLKAAQIDLSKETMPVSLAIKAYVRDELQASSRRFAEMKVQALLDDIEQEIIEKAEGMFLWVKLTLFALRKAHSSLHFKGIVHALPKGMEQLYSKIFTSIIEAADHYERTTINSILVWMIYAARTLRRHELLSVLGLRFSRGAHTSHNRTWESALDLCKPLIEEKASGSVGFIHFTAFEFLRANKSNAKISPLSAKQELAFACLTCLTKSLQLLEYRNFKETLATIILEGDFALLRYASDFWLNHWLGAVAETKDQETLDTLLGLSEVFHDRNQWTTSNEYRLTAWKPCPESNTRSLIPTTLHARQHLYQMVERLMDFEGALHEQTFVNGKEVEEWRLERDPTCVFEALTVYNKATIWTAKRNVIAEIDQSELGNYRQRMKRVLFPCRWYQCGEFFGTAALMEEHEALHVGGLKCLHLNCSFSRIGFPSVAALKKHTRRFHPLHNDIENTRHLRRKHVCTGSEGVSKWGCGMRFALRGELQRHLVERKGTKCDKSWAAPSKTGLKADPSFDLNFGALDGPDIFETFDFDSFLKHELDTNALDSVLNTEEDKFDFDSYLNSISTEQDNKNQFPYLRNV